MIKGNKIKVGMSFEVIFHQDLEQWQCPICLAYNDTTFILEDYERCEACNSEFLSFNAITLLKIGKSNPHQDVKIYRVGKTNIKEE